MIVNAGDAIVKTNDPAQASAGKTTCRKPDIVGQALLGFETRYGEAQRRASEAKAKRKKSDEDRKTVDPDSDAARYRQEAIDLRAAVRDRLENGYALPFDQHIAGRWRRAFVEEGLRSEDNPILKLVVTLVPKGGRARASNDKATLDVQSRSKLLTLDYPYIELNKEFLGALRIDCDGVFASPEALLLALEEMVRDGAIPCLPHIVVGDLRDDGTYHRPHFIFLLPPGTAVWKSDDKRCRRDIVRLFLGVSNGLTKALLPLGADPAAPATTMRMKNPLSPLWHTLTPNRHNMPTLSDYAQWVDTGSSREALARQAAAIQSGMGLKASNIAFNTLRARGTALLIQWHFAADARMKESKAALADHLHVALESYARTMELEDVRLSYVIGKVADRLAMDFDPAKLQGNKNRQRLLHVVEGMKNVRDRQRAGARFSQDIRRERSLEKLVAVYSAMLERSETLSPERLASRAGVSRSTAYRHFAACQQICASGCIDKKVGIAPCDDNPEPRQGETANGETAWGNANLEALHGQKRGGWNSDAPEAEDDDFRLIEEQETWIAVQEGRISGRQMHPDVSDVSDIIFDAHPHLAVTETPDSAMLEKGRSSALA
ncbi:hypothetical protein EGT36_21115 [Agrobacterium sp. FDAARGOS_525]|uniref:hypothetical protein n=1 Tax=Agrobacterium sp. FDAARGOS_525 TaxID=2420311 RepID=UPI000F675E39|nr:hypothetical protein [Agrobacterium sp. FDAARGOS_525]RSC31184.1 hypothetical protein EGT36_21115 [Agrobacterium sp. FDAARGOS_525]